MPKSDSRARGRRGEEVAARYLEQAGFRIASQNYHSPYGEVDLVAVREDILAFVEVKARTEGYLARPALAVTRSKRRRIVLTAQFFLCARTNAWAADLQPRFDVAEVVFGGGEEMAVLDFAYIANAFTLDDTPLAGNQRR